jgi:hypothetical protein
MTCFLDVNGTLTINREIVNYTNSSELPQSLIKTETTLTEVNEGYEANYVNEDNILFIPFSPSDNGIYGKDTGPVYKYSCSCVGLVGGTGGGSCIASAQNDGSMGCNSEGCPKCKLKITKETTYQTYSGMLVIDDGINSGIANIVLN